MRGGWRAVAVLLSACALAGCGNRPVVPASQGRAEVPATTPPGTNAPAITAAPAASKPRREVFGYSVQHRPLVAYRLGPSTAPTRLLVIGVIHGDEAAGEPIVRQLLRRWTAPTSLVVVPELNPDGVARHTRQNARRVDLNRNFPFAWQRLGKPGDQQYSGTGPLSEPESAAMAALIRRVRPQVTVWFHQPVGVVDLSGGSRQVEVRFAQLLGEPVQRLTNYPGSATRWQNMTFTGTTAFVVELPRTVTATRAAHAVTALLDLAR